MQARDPFKGQEAHFMRYGQHGNGYCRGVGSSLRLCLRHTLDAVHASFMLETAEDSFASDTGAGFLQ